MAGSNALIVTGLFFMIIGYVVLYQYSWNKIGPKSMNPPVSTKDKAQLYGPIAIAGTGALLILISLFSGK
jgi:uncharacterized membrane protein YedE/YeeE